MSGVRDVAAAASRLTDAEFLEVVRAVAAGRPGLGALAAAADVGAAGPVAAHAPEISSDDPASADALPYLATGIPDPDYTPGGVPTFDRVRDRIEERAATAIGSSELAHDSASGKSLDEQWEAREKAGKAKLEEIRRSLGKR
ncbi:hypothetical protein BFN03_08865 [Rhodococcus sp. WMMA185]|uniref:hypothetical protein n=1 Tax=Rhodococcus sp. WMMA185 TaxID=679318 RepID=UPI000878740F|nr:hypothetical protein [Rhodococcus sp. WMMA185]AOW92759.1 hypothetical protein BFN03_08865 [Rhodococcus sp. WMMA185]